MKFFTILLAAFSVFMSPAQNDGMTIWTQRGPVFGTLVSPSVSLGIPYAVANRWEASRAPPSRGAPLTATSYGDSCVQALTASAKEFLLLDGLGNRNVQESENFLSANIWTPSLQRNQSTTVVIWLYGGSFQFGTSNTVYYDGQNLVQDNDDVLIVTFNYRLNIFGQPNAPQLVSDSLSQTFFFLDAKAAIDWVHNNIAAFGGDPERITLFGESAGIIEESGSLAGISRGASPTNSSAWNQVASVVGCGDELGGSRNQSGVVFAQAAVFDGGCGLLDNLNHFIGWSTPTVNWCTRYTLRIIGG